MKKRRRFRVLTVFCIACVVLKTGNARAAKDINASEGIALPVDEDVFLKQPISFTPSGEEALDEQWLKPPDKPYTFPKAAIQNVNGSLRMTVEGEPLSRSARSCWTTTMKGAPMLSEIS